MILRGINLGTVHQASGVTNFFGPGFGAGHGWWYHKPLWAFGLRFGDSTDVSKTTTLLDRPGNMPTKKDGMTPKEWMPKCVIRIPEYRAALNAVSLTGPGLEPLLKTHTWQRRRKPIVISVMSLAKTPEGRKEELTAIFHMVARFYDEAYRLYGFRPQWVIQINFSCPNGGLDPNSLITEVVPILEIAHSILPDGIPVMPKFGPEIQPESIIRIAKEPRCDAIHYCNTMPFGKHPKWAEDVVPIDWKKIFGTDDPKESPMAKRFPGFPGGYSGTDLLRFVLAWVPKVRKLGVQIPICAGGGILCENDAVRTLRSEADAVALASIAMLAPTKVASTIKAANAFVR